MRDLDPASLLSLCRLPDLPLARQWMCARLQNRVDHTILEAMLAIPRHAFAPTRWRVAYVDLALWTGTEWLLPPSDLARILEALAIEPGVAVLEIGTGSGYLTALMSALGAQVETIDTRQACTGQARTRLYALGLPASFSSDLKGVFREDPTYDVIIVNAVCPWSPCALLSRLKRVGGVLVTPVKMSDGTQRLLRYEMRAAGGLRVLDLGSCTFEYILTVTNISHKELGKNANS